MLLNPDGIHVEHLIERRRLEDGDDHHGNERADDGGGPGAAVSVRTAGTTVTPGGSQHSELNTTANMENNQVKGRDVGPLTRPRPGGRQEATVDSLGESFGTLVPHVGGQRRD